MSLWQVIGRRGFALIARACRAFFLSLSARKCRAAGSRAFVRCRAWRCSSLHGLEKSGVTWAGCASTETRRGLCVEQALLAGDRLSRIGRWQSPVSGGLLSCLLSGLRGACVGGRWSNTKPKGPVPLGEKLFQ